MRSRLTLATLVLAALPVFGQVFQLQLTGGVVQFGAPAMNIVVSPNGGGTNGHLAKILPPATNSCTKDEAAVLAGSAPFIIRGTTTEFGHLWEVQLVFANGANQGNLSISSTNWELTGHYRMTIKDTVTGAVCTKVVGASGEYQFGGPALGGWPRNCKNPTNSPGQSPGLQGVINLHGHAGAFPIFAAGGACKPLLASQANSKIGGHGFDGATLQYKLTY